MGLIDSFKSMIRSSGSGKADKPSVAAPQWGAAPLDNARASIAAKYSGTMLRSKISIDSRFERLRSSVSGTMSRFFVARDHQTGEIVGVKLVDLEKVQFFESRFQGLNKPSESEIALGLRHPLIVQTFEAGVSTKNEPFLVMEYIDGPTLQKVITDRNEEAIAGSRLEIIRNMAESIRYVHEKGFIHRDICPRNFICLPDFSGVRLIDFGLTVPATPPFMAPGNRTGTPLYMSPEIVRRRATDQRVDVFSFGVSCYSLCSFEFPWQAAMTNGLAALQHDANPPKDILEHRPDLDPRLARAIMAAMEPNVAKRTESIDHFLRQIRGVTSAVA